MYTFLHHHAADITRVVMTNIAVPGVESWSEVIRNPYIWYSTFHSVHDLPEHLASRREADYFAYFYDALTGPNRRDSDLRQQFVQACTRPEALQTGFAWYCSFAQSEKDNRLVAGH